MLGRKHPKGKPRIVVVRPGDWLVIANLDTTVGDDAERQQEVGRLTQEIKNLTGLYGFLAVGNDLNQKEVEKATYG